jgi:hypothetical protein
MNNDTRAGIVNHRIEYIEQQIYDTQLNIKIYGRMAEEFGKVEDKQILQNEKEKLMRFEIALEMLIKELG